MTGCVRVTTVEINKLEVSQLATISYRLWWWGLLGNGLRTGGRILFSRLRCLAAYTGYTVKSGQAFERHVFLKHQGASSPDTLASENLYQPLLNPGPINHSGNPYDRYSMEK